MFTPRWEVWEESGAPEIDGLNMDLRLENYVRINMLPSFLYKRYIPIDREDWQYYYYTLFNVPRELGQDQWEYMIYSKGLINEDRFTVERCGLED